MSIRITQPFAFDSQKPNFDRDNINSSEFESQSPLKLTSDEEEDLSNRYDIGHIVWDINTRYHYRVEFTNNHISLVPLEPLIKTTQEWYNLGNNYIPKFGEVIIFSDYRQVNGENIPSFKIGNGVNNPFELPFAETDFATTSNYAETSGVANKVAHQLHIGPHDYDGSVEVTVGLYDGSYSQL